MVTVKPDYYDSFRCSGGKCTFTCCRDWSIPVDPDTEKKWKKLKRPGSTGNMTELLSSVIRSDEGQRVIRLNKDGRCPLHQSDGLCSAVCTYGEQVLSKTCHTYPREVHRFRSRTEYTLALGCPAAVDLLFDHDAFRLTVSPEKEYVFSEADEKFSFEFRNHLIRLILSPEYSPEAALGMVFWYLSDLKGKSPEIPPNYMREAFDASFLSELSAGVLNVRNHSENIVSEQNSLFLDLAGRYLEKHMYSEFLVPLTDCAADMENTGFTSEMRAQREDFEGEWKKQEKLSRILLAEEIYSTLCMPGGDFSDMMLKAEWTGLFYGLLKHCAFLRYLMRGMPTVKELKGLICLLIRMTGYTDEEICEYLENSYRDPCWDWSYFALVIS